MRDAALQRLNRRTWIAGLLVLALIAFVGCSERGLPDMVPIRGTVTYQDKPLQEGTVLYLPKSADGRQARGEIQPDGTYRLTTLRKHDGAQHGEYDIVVIALEPHPGEPPSREEVEARGGIQRKSILPPKFTNPETSRLSDSVDDRHPGVMDLELTDEGE